MDSYNFTIEEAANGLRKKDFSSVDLTKSYLDRIEKLNPQFNAFLTVEAESALEQAEAADKRLKDGDNHPLLGVPTALKDNMAISGGRTTAGSKILENFVAPYTATAARKLIDQGAVILGKTNLDEFAMGSSTENSAFGPSKNPWDKERVPGGSSGGSVVAVAAGMTPYALGSDTGGSIRQPASFCGVVGLKPTYGRVSRAGLLAMAASLDQIGPITHTVKDAAMVLGAIAGFDEKDSTTHPRPPQDFTIGLDEGIKGMKIGVPQEFFVEGMDKGVWDRVNEALGRLDELGAEIVDISLPSLKLALATYYIIVPVEVASNLARYDGIKYGLSLREGAMDLTDLYKKTRAAGFGTEAKRRIMLGTYTSSAGYYDAYYKKAVAARQVIQKELSRAFESVDLIAGATSPSVAFKIGEKVDDPMQMYLADVLTVPTNIAGLPGISIPCGMSENLPVGLQLQAPWWEEAKLLRAAYTFEQAGEYYKMRPTLEV